MESGRSGSDGSASAELFSRQDVENDRHRRSRSKVFSTYPGGYVCGTFFTVALLTAILNILHQLVRWMIS